MGNELTKIVLDTQRLKKELGYKISDSLAINYQGLIWDNADTVFFVLNELVTQTEEQENRLEVTLREGMTPQIKCDKLYIKTNQPEIRKVKVPSWLGEGRIDVPIPFTRKAYYCANLKYLISVHKGDKIIYQRQ